MPTLKQMRLQSHLTISELARLANVDRKTVERAEGGQPVLDAKAYAIVEVLAKRLGREINFSEVEGLNIL